MKKSPALMILLVSSAASAGNLRVSLGAKVDSVSANYAQEAGSTEVIIPLGLSYSLGKDTDFSAKMGYAKVHYVNQALTDPLDKTFSGITDFSFAARHAFGRGAIKPYVTARVNAPTGDQTWNAFRVLADIPNEYSAGDILGRGLTYGGTLGLKGSWGEGDAELSGGFIKNEAVNPAEGEPDLEMQAGAVGLVKGSLGLNKELDLRFEGTYVGSGATTVEKEQVFKQRSVFLGSFSASRAFGPARASFIWGRSYFGRSQVAPAGALVEEARPRLAHRDDYRLEASIKAGRWTFGAGAGIRKVEANGFRDITSKAYDAGGTALRQSLFTRSKLGALGTFNLSVTRVFARDLQEAFDDDGTLTSVDYQMISTEASFSHGF